MKYILFTLSVLLIQLIYAQAEDKIIIVNEMDNLTDTSGYSFIKYKFSSFSLGEFNIKHKQMLNESSFIDLDYTKIKGNGPFVNSAINSTNLDLRLQARISSNFSLATQLYNNVNKVGENGGIKNILIYEELNSFYNTNEVNMNLESALSISGGLLSNSILKYSLDTFNHNSFYFNFQHQDFSYKFSDQNLNMNFYDKILLDSLKTNDGFDKWSNYYGLGYEYNSNHHFFNFSTYYFHQNYSNLIINDTSYQSLLLRLNYNYKNNFLANVTYSPLGYDKGMSTIDVRYIFDSIGDFVDSTIISGKYSLEIPLIQKQNYISNHVLIDNNFMIIKNISINMKSNFKRLNSSIELNYRGSFNDIYLDSSLVFKQSSSYNDLFKLRFSNHLKFGNFLNYIIADLNVNNKNSIYRIPTFSVENIISYTNTAFKNRLKYTTGARVYYYTNYFADGFYPVLNAYFLQNRMKIGNYPYIDLFANISIQRVDLGLRVVHINSGFFGNNYYDSYLYPSFPRYFQFHINWKLFN